MTKRTTTEGLYYHACMALLRNPRVWRMDSSLSYINSLPNDEVTVECSVLWMGR